MIPRSSLSQLEEEKLVVKACDFSDVLDLAQNPRHRYRRASHDDKHQIEMHTKAVSSSPIQLMKARSVMPCPPTDFLRYLDMDVRSLWDEHFMEGVVIKELTRAVAPSPSCSSSSIAALPDSSSKGTNNANTTSTGSSSCGSKQHVKVQLKHVGFLSPIPLLLNRDFELVVAEHVTSSGVAILKAFSPPTGSVVPQRPDYVRGIVSISGFIAEPLEYYEPRLKRNVHGCQVTYVALVDPKGLIPSFLVNTVVGKQTSGLLQLQDFIARNSLASLVKQRAISSHLGEGAKCGVVMRGKQFKSKL